MSRLFNQGEAQTIKDVAKVPIGQNSLNPSSKPSTYSPQTTNSSQSTISTPALNSAPQSN